MREKIYRLVFKKITRISHVRQPIDPLLCCLVHCLLSAYGSRYGSAGFPQISAQLFDTEYKRKVPKPWWFRNFYGCGGRTRTYDLRVMSPTSFQLLYSAMFVGTSLSACVLYHGHSGLSRTFLLLGGRRGSAAQEGWSRGVNGGFYFCRPEMADRKKEAISSAECFSPSSSQTPAVLARAPI